MPMIQGIDANSLIQAFRAGRSDRAADDKAKATAERQKEIGGLMGQLFGSTAPAGGGVTGQYAPSNPQPKTFGEVFTPEGIANAGPETPSPMVTAQAPQRAPDPNVMAKLIALDPEMGGKIANAFKDMNDANLKATEAKNSHMGATAHWLRQFPPQERAARLQAAAPTLLQQGFTPQELERADLSDAGLSHIEAHAIDFDKLIDNELANREFMAGKTVPVTAGGSVAVVRPKLDPRTGNVIGTTQEYIIGGGGASSTPASGIPAEAIADLKAGKGTPEQFDSIFGAGTAQRILGGGGGNATGGFQSGQ